MLISYAFHFVMKTIKQQVCAHFVFIVYEKNIKITSTLFIVSLIATICSTKKRHFNPQKMIDNGFRLTFFFVKYFYSESELFSLALDFDFDILCGPCGFVYLLPAYFHQRDTALEGS